MPDHEPTFRDRLINSETVNPRARESYQEELGRLLKGDLSRGRRGAMIIVGLSALASAAMFVGMTFVATMTTVHRVALFGAAAFAVAIGFVTLRTARRGQVRRKSDPVTHAGLMWAFTVFLVTVFLLMAWAREDRAGGALLVASGLVFQVSAGVGLILARGEQRETRIREDLLRIEYSVATRSLDGE